MNVSRESIFVSAFRSFCNAIAGMIGIVVVVISLAIFFQSSSKLIFEPDKPTIHIIEDEKGKRTILPHTTPMVLRLNIHGIIGSRELNSKNIKTKLLASREGLLKKERVKAILLHINTPGGTVIDANNIYMSLMEYKEKYKVPIYAYVDGLCASGGMYIACAADKILSNPVGIIGSVGVILGPNFNIYKLMEKMGIEQMTLTRGKDKDILSPFRPWKANEDAPLNDIIDYDYKRFISIVTKNRPRINKNKLINEYGANVFDPFQAKQIGYIDNGNASYYETLKELVKVAGIEEDYQVIELKISYPILQDLVEGKSPLFSGKIKHEIGLIPDYKVEWINHPLYLYLPALY